MVPPILLYDEKCHLCLRFKQALEQTPIAKGLTLVSIHSDEVYRRFPKIKKDEALKDIHYLNSSGKIFIGKNAISQLVLEYPPLFKFSWLLKSDIGKKTLNYFYQTAENYRLKLKKDCDNCK